MQYQCAVCNVFAPKSDIYKNDCTAITLMAISSSSSLILNNNIVNHYCQCNRTIGVFQ